MAVAIIERLLRDINDYIGVIDCESHITLIPDIKQLCMILEEATRSYLQFDLNNYNDNIDDINDIQQEMIETAVDAANEDSQIQMRKRLEGYKRKSLISLKKHSDFKRQISNNTLNCKTDIFFIISLYTYFPNQAYYENYYNLLKYYVYKYYDLTDDGLQHKILEIIMEYLPTSLSFESNDDNCKQITFGCNGGMLNFEQSTDDFMNIISNECVLYSDTDEYDNILINCYIISKGDEMWLGLIDKNTFEVKKSVEREKNVLLYYGARQRLIGTCKAFGYWDTGKGAIHAFGNVEKKDIPYYQHGSWISFRISLDKKGNTIKIYNDDECVYEGHKLPQGDNGIYFMVVVDDEIDAIFVEKAMSYKQM